MFPSKNSPDLEHTAAQTIRSAPDELPRSGITAVIVLYERAPSASETFTSFSEILGKRPEWREQFQIVLYDNSAASPDCAKLPQDEHIRYIHDRENGGLIAAYNCALKHAQDKGSEWLLLLDQDTVLSDSYVDALVSARNEYRSFKKVSVIVPILECGGRIYSPAASYLFHLRHQLPRSRHYPLDRTAAGIQTRQINAYGSGALIRVSALEIGGFPRNFRVDYLDTAVFHLLQKKGGSIAVLPVVLQQQLSHTDLNSVSYERHRSVMRAQSLFVTLYGRLVDRFWLRLYLLRLSRHYRRHCRDVRVWRRMVWQALAPWHWTREERYP